MIRKDKNRLLSIRLKEEPLSQEATGKRFFFYNFLIPLQRDVPGLWDFWIREKDNESLTLSPETAALIRF